MRAGDVPVALIVPTGFGATPLSFAGNAKRPTVEILSDSADPIAPQVLGGLVQKVAMTAMPGAMARSGVAEVDQWSGGLTPEQKARMDAVIAEIEKEPEVPPGQAAPPACPAAAGRAASSTSRCATSWARRRRTRRSPSTPRASASCSCSSRRRAPAAR